jgi:voltage-gated potassium channel
MIGAVVFLTAYGIPIIWPDISPLARDLADWVSWIVWAAFAGDFLVRLLLASNRATFLRKNWLDIPVIALPLLRPLRLLRLVTLLRFLDRRATSGLRGKVLAYVIGGSTLLALVGSLAVLDAERQSSTGNIQDFGDAMWWAVTTMKPVGYGDKYPTTVTGRLVAVCMMVGGIAILGTVTAAVASWLVERVQEAAEPENEVLRRIEDLQIQVEKLTKSLAVAGLPTPTTHPEPAAQLELPGDRPIE